MGLKRGRGRKPADSVKELAEGVKVRDKKDRTNNVLKSATTGRKREVDNPSKAKSFVDVTLTSTKGQTYKVAIPASYVSVIPKEWSWNEDRYKVAELIAMGVPIAQIPDQPGVLIGSKMTIYAWLEHPEFRDYVDGIIMETGWASRRERLQNLQILNQRLLNKILNELDSMKLTDKNVGSILTAIQAGAKLIAQEKGEFIEESRVTQDMNVTGTVTNITAKLDSVMASKTAEEIAELEREFNAMGDDIIRAITGDKE